MNKDGVMHILGEEVKMGESVEASFGVAKLHSRNPVEVPVIINRSKKPGPTVLITAGIHGDEVNGVEIVRQIIAKGINKPRIGTIICIPVINIFGFIHMERKFPDGRDLNRVFPGSKTGSLASRVANKLVTEVVPHADLIIDYHTGGADRFNSPQVRISKKLKSLDKLATTFGAPFVLQTTDIKKSFRGTCNKLGIPLLLFEGGKSFNIDPVITNTGVNGCKRILSHMGMLKSNFKVSNPKKKALIIIDSRWVRAKHSGMFKASIALNSYVEKGTVLGNITDPYGKFNHFVKAQNSGYIFNINQSPIVYQGDALFHISTKTK